MMGGGRRWPPGTRLAAILTAGLVLPWRPVPALAQDWDAIPVETAHLRGPVHAVLGAGTNITFAVGAPGVLVVDAGYAELAPRVWEQAVALLPHPGERPVYVVNTHWHFDHVGGNTAFASRGGTVMASEATAALLSEARVMAALDSLPVDPVPPEGRPRVRFTEGLRFVWGADTVDVRTFRGAHTASDAVAFFRPADVVHLGDLFFNRMYPYIDVDHGGSLSGLIRALEVILHSVGPETIVVPGHGAPAGRADLERYLGMLSQVGERMGALIAQGFTREEAIAAKPTFDLDAVWSRGGGFNDPDVWVGIVYDGEVRAQRAGAAAPHGGG